MEFEHSSKASFIAKVGISPKLSHAFLSILLLLSLVPLLAGFVFLWFEKETAWIPFFIFILLLLLAVLGWLLTRKSIDMSNSIPTTLRDRNGNVVTTDSRSLESSNAVTAIGSLLQTIGERKPLPEPDGLVDQTHKIIPDSKNEAVQKANMLNEEIEKESLLCMESSMQKTAVSEQRKHSLVEISYEEVLEHNRVLDQE